MGGGVRNFADSQSTVGCDGAERGTGARKLFQMASGTLWLEQVG